MSTVDKNDLDEFPESEQEDSKRDSFLKSGTKKQPREKAPEPAPAPKKPVSGDGSMSLDEYLSGHIDRSAGRLLRIGFRRKCGKLGLAGSRFSADEWTKRYDAYLRSG